MSESDIRDFDPARPRTLATLRRLAAMKGYAEPKPGILEYEAKQAISWLTRLQPDPETGKAKRLPAPTETETPHMTLRGWHTRRP